MISAWLSDLATALGSRIVAAANTDHNVEIVGVSTDTRTMQAGNLFVALKGEHFDGHDFIQAAKQQGASAAIVSAPNEVDLPQVQVADTTIALGEIARRWRLCCPARVVGITGSNGKTTVKMMAHAILSHAGKCHGTAGNLNNEIGLPLTLCALPDDARFAVLELGAGKPGDISYLAQIAHPDVALVNNIAPAHLERMHSLAAIAETKGAIYSALDDNGIAIINAEEPFADYFAGLAAGRTIYRFGLNDSADVRGRILKSDETQTLADETQTIAIETPLGKVEIRLPLPGIHNARNALAATALALAAGASLTHIQAGLESSTAVAGRLVQHMLPNGAILIDDSYNANPGSMRAAVDTLASQHGPRWLVVGDMLELGHDSNQLHEDVGKYAREHGIDALFAVGTLALHVCHGFGSGARHFPNQSAMIAALRQSLDVGVRVLIKGSRSSAMDRVVTALLNAEHGGQSHVA